MSAITSPEPPHLPFKAPSGQPATPPKSPRDKALPEVDYIPILKHGDEEYWDGAPMKLALPANSIEYLDEAVRIHLPPGTQLVSMTPTGFSSWARTARITTIDADGVERSYFLKVQGFERGKQMSDTEFRATSEMHTHAPELVRRPIAIGVYASDPNLSFYLTHFRRMARGIPTAQRLVSAIFAMHTNSEADSAATGRTTFGCAATPDHKLHAGPVTIHSPPADSWLEAFTLLFRNMFTAERAIHGFVEDKPASSGMDSREDDAEMVHLVTETLERVVPRLLGPLEQEGRRIVPALVHGDLWDANSGVDLDSGEVMIFDSLNIWAHREYEFGPWLVSREKLAEAGMMAEYMKLYEPCEPVEDFEDRIQLYKARFELGASISRHDDLWFRERVKEILRPLVAKYGRK